MKTYEQVHNEINLEILDFMKRHPETYGHMNTVDEYLEYHYKKYIEESIKRDLEGWEGD